MDVIVTRKTSWLDVKKAAKYTMWQDTTPDEKEPSAEWKHKILLARHSPIESLVFQIEMRGIPSWVSVHFVRHKIGVTHYVSSQRDDRHTAEKPRAEMPQGTPVNHMMFLNAQEILFISQRRLCACASNETRETWRAVVAAIAKVDPDLALCCMPQCRWCGGHCPEMKGCGKYPSLYELLFNKGV